MKSLRELLSEAKKNPSFKNPEQAVEHFKKHAHHVMKYLSSHPEYKAKPGGPFGADSAHEELGFALEDVASHYTKRSQRVG
jgi:hypothetical protein